MVYNPILKREIPEGWEVKSLKDFVAINKNKAEPDQNLRLIDLSVMPSDTMCLNQCNIGNAFETNLYEMKKFDILFGSIRPYLLKAGFAPFDGLVTGTIHSISPNSPNIYNWLLLTMISSSLFNHAITSSKGTKMPVIGINDLLDYKIAYCNTIVSLFNAAFSFKEKIAKNVIENLELAQIRDFLLPMVMNGQVEVLD